MCIRDSIRDDQCFSLKNLKVNGRDLLGLGVPRVPEIGRILEILLEQVIDGDIPNEKRAVSYTHLDVYKRQPLERPTQQKCILAISEASHIIALLTLKCQDMRP